ncbi:tetratricopeptide repeat protein [Pseudobacter ginsenosidimutans]|uniref:Tetratricopeptide repeat protein n=1 Tax=Pseudobacter ginsenosidimutans TaxID=661488 RepID=A0A4Q7MU48_9BACT|nr:tetratricopeptide repeat protein [Pseudobacter ginsenosidimutans]QEC40882.1 tetratricopeptide repeat protein [Pseudobacter ginsenosidimutans]RZS72385.1 tetratricopeptide repeat protein [Pseudobacter ginsenosidimutans]
MFKPLRFLLVAAMLFSLSASACLNEYQRKEMPLDKNKLHLHLLLHSKEDEMPYWWHGFDGESLHSLEDMAGKNIAELNYKQRSDYAVAQLKVGDKAKGLQILQDLYRSYPNEYNIVANLGTAYELNGDKTKALECLKKAVAINPLSHFGSEWIHVRILEEQLAATPDYKKIINLNTGNFQDWLTDKTYRFPRPADSLKLQIAYQLHERIAFIAPPNAVIGQLVTDFGDIVAKTDSLGAAFEFYQFALKYDSTLKDSIDVRINGVKASQKEVKDTFRWATIVWAIPLLALVMIFLAWLRSLRNNKKADS